MNVLFFLLKMQDLVGRAWESGTPPNEKVQKSAILFCKLPGIQNHYDLKCPHHRLPKILTKAIGR